MACRKEWEKRHEKILTCKVCGKETPKKGFYAKRDKGYCSKSCVGKSRGGKIPSRYKREDKVWSLINADRFFSQFIRTRDNWTCRLCKKTFIENKRVLHNSHFWGRGRMSTRFDPDNCIAACYSCHYFKLEKEKQGTYRTIMLEWLGEEKYKQLEDKANKQTKRRDAIKELMGWIEPYIKELNWHEYKK